MLQDVLDYDDSWGIEFIYIIFLESLAGFVSKAFSTTSKSEFLSFKSAIVFFASIPEEAWLGFFVSLLKRLYFCF